MREHFFSRVCAQQGHSLRERKIQTVLLWATCLLICGMISVAFAGQSSGRNQVGNDTCLSCHEDVARSFSASKHGQGQCESCHGPGSAHADDPKSKNILNPESMLVADANEVCLHCHDRSREIQYWSTSRHASSDIKCASCHEVHGAWSVDHALRTDSVNESCFSCHPQTRKSMFQRSSHPMRNGQMQCSSCHNPHGSMGDKALLKPTVNETCYTCHMEKRGPFLFEHAPVREDCLSCHIPHGSNNTMLLKAQTARLCQSCHLLGHHQTVASQPGQIWVQNRACVNCHSQIHGSNHPSGAIFMR